LTLFLGYTSNLISSGLREILRFLAQYKLVDCIVTTAGGIEEDFIKCLGSTVLGDFHLDGATLRKKGYVRPTGRTQGEDREADGRLNRIGNLLVPNSNYCAFEDWAVPILHQLVAEQAPGAGHGEDGEGERWSPSKIIRRLGKEIDNEESVYYWCYKVRSAKLDISASCPESEANIQNDIPVFCPALTDGSLGDMIYFHTYKTETQLSIDIVQDIRRLNDMSVKAKQAGMIILGGGVCKHQIANAMLFVSPSLLLLMMELIE
jgi:deoxyhypusine synthase